LSKSQLWLPSLAFGASRLQHCAPSALPAFGVARLRRSAPSALRAFGAARLRRFAPAALHEYTSGQYMTALLFSGMLFPYMIEIQR
jgi:hypothetical protein